MCNCQAEAADVATPSLTTPDPFDSVAAGEQRSRGVELEGSFQITPGWELTTVYTYDDAEITKDKSLPAVSAYKARPSTPSARGPST